MMKKSLLLGACATLLAACASETTPKAKPTENAIGMANPASIFCEQQGGKSVTRKNQDGSEYGVCVFADGKEVDEWDYFRQHNK